MHLVDATMFYGPRSGGVKRYLQAKHGWLARHAPSVRHTSLVPAPHGDVMPTVGCEGLALALPDGYRLPLDVYRWYRALLDLQPSIIEAADPYVPGWAVRAAAHKLNVPAVAFYHSDVPRMLAMRVGDWIKPVARRYLCSFYAGFDLVLAPSQVMLRQLHRVGIEHAQLQALGVDTEIFHPRVADPALRRQLNLAENTRLLVYAGRFAREKNLEVLTAAASRLGRPYHLLLIGGRRRTRLSPQVTVLPYQRSADRLARLLASCDVFVHAGDQETYGLVAAEAMACGLPVVGVAHGAIPEIVDETVGALARRVDGQRLAIEIAGIFERDRTQLQRAARARAEASYGWDHVFRSLLSRYSSLVSAATNVSLDTASVRT